MSSRDILIEDTVTLGDFMNISTISIFLLAVAPYNFYYLLPKWCKLPFLDSKINRGDIRLYFKSYEKIPRWRHCWIIWHLIVKTKISPLVVRYQGSNGCQKKWPNLTNLDLEVYCANIQLNLTKLWSSPKNQSLLLASGGFLKFLQYWLNISAITQQIYL